MKPQDLVFLVVLLALIVFRSKKGSLLLGMGSLIIAIPLFYRWIFFTAQRLVIYGAAFLLVSLLFSFIQEHFSKISS